MKNRLKVLRAERDWSQAELADRLNVSRQTINAIEPKSMIPVCRCVPDRGVVREKDRRDLHPGKGMTSTKKVSEKISQRL